MIALLFLLQLAAIIAVNIQLRKINMNQAELQQALADLGAQLTKALDEIRAAIERGGQTTPEVDAALANARTVAQALDDLNPDA